MKKWVTLIVIVIIVIAAAQLLLPEIDSATTFQSDEDTILGNDSTIITGHTESQATSAAKAFSKDDALYRSISPEQDMENESFLPIKLRDSGINVKEIQILLQKFGYDILADGNFNPQTKKALKSFQSHVQLEPNGIVDETTYNKLQSLEPSNLAAAEEKNRLEEKKKKEAKAQEVYIPVPTIMQKPELPNGCEITTLTSVLNYYGYQVSKTNMADNYLPKKPFTYEGEKRFGPNPYEYYVGDPREQPGGWYSYAPPIVTAANTYLSEQGSNKKAYNITGSSKEAIIDYLHKGIPVVMWVTLDLSAPKINSHWYFQDSGEYYAATTNLHVVVLYGKIGDQVHVMDPLQGQVTYNADVFFNSYFEMGKHALIVH
ncbi:C39 family peptidase [Ornithinibacillus massiliensis]|uniref:C39 family peptidase n=1 Tax=Ornithinibacillus massiliensis TaxID=1944633 RepID=A0ABS5MID9_9BACI|nr:C39 family peptidase [Ornithinibacillus massiliensis]